MIQVKSIYHLILSSIVFIIILISSFTYIIIDNTFDEFQNKIDTLEVDYTNKQKGLIKSDLNKIISFISYYHKRFKIIKPEKEIQEDILKAIDKMRKVKDINDNIFIYNFVGKAIYYPSSKENQNKNFYDQIDIYGKNVVKDLIDISQEEDGGYIRYTWYKKDINENAPIVSYALAYNDWNWTIGSGLYLDDVKKQIKIKQYEYDKRISNYIFQILSLTIMIVLYSIFLYKNATLLIVNDVKEIGVYFEEAEKSDNPINQNRLTLGEFKIIANYANHAMNNIKVKTHVLEDLNKHLQIKVDKQTQELTNLLESQKQFLKHSVHEINTPLSIIQTNIDLCKIHEIDNKYLTNIQNGIKIIQNIYDDLSYMIKKDRVEYKKSILNFSEILDARLNFFDEIVKSNSLSYLLNKEEDIHIRFNKTSLERVIDNNISNAIKYSHANSKIKINLHYDQEDYIIFEVITNSQKIEEENKIFDDFYRENSYRGGFGLGLKIVKEICDKNNVIIKLNSNTSETKFSYRFKIDENTTT